LTARAPRNRDDLVVLGYHALSDDWPAALSVTPAQFASQLEHLVRRGYVGVTFSEAVLGSASGKRVVVTFDDGYRSVVERARPIMERLRVPGTLFVVTDWIGRGPMRWPGIDRWIGGEHEHELVPMSWQEARSLRDAGWEIGSHTKSHPYLTQLDDRRLADELAASRSACERELGARCASLSYPYGDHDARVIAAAAAAGYATAAALPAGNPAPEPLAWPRVGVYHSDGGLSFRLKVSPAIRRLRRTRAWGPAMSVVQAMRRRSKT